MGEGVFGRRLAAIDNFTALPSAFIDGGDHVVVLGRYSARMKDSGATLDSPFCHVHRFHCDKAVTFQQYTDTAQWARLMASPEGAWRVIDARGTRVRRAQLCAALILMHDRIKTTQGQILAEPK